MVRRLLIGGMLACAAPAAALAQPAHTLVELKARVETGDVIYVMDREGRETKGPLMALSDTSLTIGLLGDRYDVPIERVARVDRAGDSVWNGFAIGAAVGGVMGLLAQQGCRLMSDGCAGYYVAAGVLTYGGIGAIIDLAHTGRTRIYAAPLEGGNKTLAIAPILSRERKGAALANRW